MQFPPFIALVIALIFIPTTYPEWLTLVLKQLGDTLAPLALVSVGYQLRLSHLAGNGRNLAIGLGFKLVLAPLILLILYVPLFGAHGQAIQITLFEAAMPPMVTAAILAAEHDLDPHLATLMVAVGMMLSFSYADRLVVGDARYLVAKILIKPFQPQALRVFTQPMLC